MRTLSNLRLRSLRNVLTETVNQWHKQQTHENARIGFWLALKAIRVIHTVTQKLNTLRSTCSECCCKSVTLLSGKSSFVLDPIHEMEDTGEGVGVSCRAPNCRPEGGNAVNHPVFTEIASRVTLESIRYTL